MNPEATAAFAVPMLPSCAPTVPAVEAATVPDTGARASAKEVRVVFNLKWLLIFAASLIGLVVCGMLGLLKRLWEVDSTMISFGILALYLVVSSFVGWLTAHAPKHAVDEYRRACGFTPELMMGLGMLGTIIGFLLMLGPAFRGLDASNVQSMQAALGHMASGMGVALTTTLVGLACSMLLQLQLVNMDLARR